MSWYAASLKFVAVGHLTAEPVELVPSSGSTSKWCVVKVRTLDIAPLRGTPPEKRSGTDHTVLPANFTVPAPYLVTP